MVWPRAGVLAVLSLLAGVLEIGGWLRERRAHGPLELGAHLLLLAGLIAAAASIVHLLSRQPPKKRKPKPPPEIPTARVVSS